MKAAFYVADDWAIVIVIFKSAARSVSNSAEIPSNDKTKWSRGHVG